MNMSIALQRPPYKGKLNFDEETYLGVIAFGNALGNSIVRGLQQRPKPVVSTDPDNGKFSPNQFEAFDVMKAAQAQKQKAVNLTQQQYTPIVNTTVEDIGAAYFADNPLYNFDLKTNLSEFTYDAQPSGLFSLNQDIMSGVGMPSLSQLSGYQLDSGLTSSNGGKQNYYDRFLSAWELGKKRVLNNLDQAAISDGGGFITAAAAFVKFPAQLGFGLIDTGLSLGGIVASSNVRQYQVGQLKTAWNDFTTTSDLVVDEFVTDIFSGEDDIRFTVDSDLQVINGKSVIGTDFYGAQFKNLGTSGTSNGLWNTDEVVRYASDWNGNNSTSIILEKSTSSFSLPLPKAWRSAGIFVGVSVGARYNLTTSKVRSAVNFKIQTPVFDFGIDWRGANHTTSNGG